MKSTAYAIGLVLLLVAGVPVDRVEASPPAQDRQKIQEMIGRGNPLRQKFVADRAAFIESYKKWKKSGTEADRQGAIVKRDTMRASRDRVKANRDSVIAKVDSTYDTREPAGTDVQYDPECTDYGYTSSRCFVRICEPSFTSPDDVATTKIHEFEHVRQKQAGKWGPGVGTPQPCTHLFHELEFDAYEAEMDADFGKRTSLSTEVKLEILQRKLEHLRGMIDDLAVRISGDKIKRSLTDTVIEREVTVTNESDLERSGFVEFQNQQGWPTTPAPVPFTLGSERDTTFTLTVPVPPWAELGAGNEVLCHATSSSGAEARDFFFVHVIPVAEVRAGPNVSGRPGHWVDFQFTVVNEGPVPDQFEVYMSSVLGWPLAQNYWSLPLGSGASVDLQGSVQIPPGAPYTTDLILCTALSITMPDHDDGWVYAEIEPGSSDVGTGQARDVALMPGVPNPFVRGTTLRFSVPSRGPVDLGIYDVTGRRVRTLVSGDGGAVAPGTHAVAWDGKDHVGRRVAGGIYFARLRACNQGIVRKLVVLQ